MKAKTKVIKHNNNFKQHYDFNNINILYPKPKVRTQVPNPYKSPNKTSKLVQINKQQNKPNSNKTQFPPINPEPNKFPIIKNQINNHFYNSPGKEIPKTEIKRDKIDIDDEYKKKIGTAIIPKNNNNMDMDDEYKKKIGTAIIPENNNNMDMDDEYKKKKEKEITSQKNKKINKDNLQIMKEGKTPTTINKNEKDFGFEKDKNIGEPKTEILPNKINLDTTPKINQNKNQNQVEKESEDYNLCINSINKVRLPDEFTDISFELLKAK